MKLVRLVLVLAGLVPVHAWASPSAPSPLPSCEEDFINTRDLISEVIEPFIRNPQPYLDIPEVGLHTFEGSELARNFIALAEAGVLLNQKDRRLHQYGLLLPNGGLCSGTCVVNALATVVIPPHRGDVYHTRAPQMMRAMVKGYRETVAELFRAAGWPGRIMEALDPIMGWSDARRGASNSLMLKTLDRIAPSVRIRIHRWETASALNMAAWSRKNTLMIAEANVEEAGGRMEDGDDSGHAIVILKVDPISQEVWASDPNRPNQVYRERYHTGNDGLIVFRSRVAYSRSGFPTSFRVYGLHVLEKLDGSETQ